MLITKTGYVNNNENGGSLIFGNTFYMWWRAWWDAGYYRINILSHDSKIDIVKRAVIDDFGTLVCVE